MINLIPNQEKKKMARDFYMRIVIMFFTVFALALIIGSSALIPSYWLSNIKQKLIAERLSHQSYMPVPPGSQDVLDIAKSLERKFRIIDNAEAKKFIISEQVINKIVSKQIPGIKITDITVTVDPIEGRKISIRGGAISRDKLLNFSQSLSDDKSFKKVDLPISNFIKGSDIQFYLTLIPS